MSLTDLQRTQKGARTLQNGFRMPLDESSILQEGLRPALEEHKMSLEAFQMSKTGLGMSLT